MNAPLPESSGRPPRIIGIALVCAGVVLAAAAFERRFSMGSPARIAFALAQAAATAVMIVAIYRNITRLDELQQRIMLEALALAFAGTGLLASGYGFLEEAGLPHFEWGVWAWPVMVIFWAIGLVISKWRYR